MKYLAIVLFVALCSCDSIETAKTIAEEMECSWSSRYNICICAYKEPRGYRGYMTIAPNRVCNRIVMPEIEITGNQKEPTL